MQQQSSTFTRVLISFHSIYFIVLGSTILFFTEWFLGLITDNITGELIAIHRYFAALLIISGLLFKDFLNSEKNLLKILVYLLFFSIVSLLVMTDKAETESLGDYYYVFRLILILLIVVQSALEIKKSMQSE
jgi:hypothetical protein